MRYRLIQNYMTRNDCYTANNKIVPKGIMIHSTATPGIMAGGWYSRWNKSFQAGETNRQVCVHAFLDDKEVYQYLPWDHRGWHAGGSANNTHIGIEICEPGGFKYENNVNMVGYDVTANQAYFQAIWNNAIDLCVMLCAQFKISPEDILCHSEGALKGIASRHADVMHWFPKHGKDMDMFRAEVKKKSLGSVGSGKIYKVQVGAFEVKNNARNLLKHLAEQDILGFITTEDELYKVQVGAYAEYENAIRAVNKLKDMGINAIIK